MADDWISFSLFLALPFQVKVVFWSDISWIVTVILEYIIKSIDKWLIINLLCIHFKAIYLYLLLNVWYLNLYIWIPKKEIV